MTGDALFGPDGTQPPAPFSALSDPLVAPGAAPSGERNGQVPAAASFGGAVPAMPAVPLPAGVDPSVLRDAIRAALGDEPAVPQPPVQPAPQPAPQPPSDSMLTPPSGIPVQLGRPPPPGMPGQPPVVPPPGATAAQPGQSPLPPSTAPPAPPPPGQPVQPAQRPSRPPAQWPADHPRPHLNQARRNPSGGGWIGCIVLLIFIAIVTFNIVSALIDAITGG